VNYASYRKDRVRVIRGGSYLREYRLKLESPTRRVTASCCGSPMFTDFTPGHWVSIYRGRVPWAPPSQMSLMTQDKLDGVGLPTDIPAYKRMPVSLMVKLVASWAAMGFRRPKIVW
jgi:hypothetical protein